MFAYSSSLCASLVIFLSSNSSLTWGLKKWLSKLRALFALAEDLGLVLSTTWFLTQIQRLQRVCISTCAHVYMQASIHTHKIKYIFKTNFKSVTSPGPHSRSLDCSQNPKYACTDILVLPLSTIPVYKLHADLHCWVCLLSWTCLSPISYCFNQIPWQKQLKEGGCNWLIVPGCSPSLVGSAGQWWSWPVHAACLCSAPSLSLSPRPGSSNDIAHIQGGLFA